MPSTACRTCRSALTERISQVKSSANSVEDAQRRVAKAGEELEKAQEATAQATEKFGVNSDEAAKALAREQDASEKYKAAQDDLKMAQEKYAVAAERADMIQGNFNETIAQSAMTIIPSAITMVDSFSRVWKNFPDVTGMLSNVSSRVGDVGHKREDCCSRCRRFYWRLFGWRRVAESSSREFAWCCFCFDGWDCCGGCCDCCVDGVSGYGNAWCGCACDFGCRWSRYCWNQGTHRA